MFILDQVLPRPRGFFISIQKLINDFSKSPERRIYEGISGAIQAFL
jgi:hypothetical protein